MERFVGNCNTICSSTTLTDDLKATCDLGSLDYCTKSGDAALIGAECKTFIPRVVGTYVAEQRNSVYSNPIKIPAGATRKVPDYFNSIASVAKDYAIKDPINLASTFTSDFVANLTSNGLTTTSNAQYKDLAAAAMTNCSSASPNATLCSTTNTNAWFYKYIKDEYVPSLVSAYAVGPLNAYAANPKLKALHNHYPELFKPFENLIISKITKADLSNPLLIELRTYSSNMRNGIDNFVINLIKVSKEAFVKERFDDMVGTATYGTPTLENGLVNKPVAYDADIQKFLAEINKYRAADGITTPDPLITLFKQTTESNVTYCGSTNPLTTPVCVTMKTAAATDPTLQTAINTATKTYCTTNVQDPTCVSYINSKPTEFNLNDVNQKMLNYCMSAAGKADVTNCKSFSSINGSGDWLKEKTKNIVTKNADGTVTNITTVCGTANGLPKETCINVCSQYPDLCKADIQDKCGAPLYRYSSNTEVFSNKEKMSDNEESWLIGGSVTFTILFLILLIFFVRWMSPGLKKMFNSSRVDEGKFSEDIINDEY